MPFPASTQRGERIKVRLLDGRGDQVTTLRAAAALVPAGAEIGLFGNADRFDYEASVVEYYDVNRQADAERLAYAVGASGAKFRESAQETVDVTVIVGRAFTSNGFGR